MTPYLPGRVQKTSVHCFPMHRDDGIHSLSGDTNSIHVRRASPLPTVSAVVDQIQGKISYISIIDAADRDVARTPS